jgi:hypothetical protein
MICVDLVPNDDCIFILDFFPPSTDFTTFVDLLGPPTCVLLGESLGGSAWFRRARARPSPSRRAIQSGILHWRNGIVFWDRGGKSDGMVEKGGCRVGSML